MRCEVEAGEKASDETSETSDIYYGKSAHNQSRLEHQGVSQNSLSRGVLIVVLFVASLCSGVATYYFIAKNDKNDNNEKVCTQLISLFLFLNCGNFDSNFFEISF